jgi:hypothetical protein
LFEVEAKAWTTMSADVVPFLEASFPTSPPTVLDVAGENLPMKGYLVGAFASFPQRMLSSSAVASCHLVLVVPQRIIVFLMSFLVVS